MATIILTKKYKLAWKSDKTIIINSETEGSIAVGNATTFEADTKAEIDAKITELGLIKEE